LKTEIRGQRSEISVCCNGVKWPLLSGDVNVNGLLIGLRNRAKGSPRWLCFFEDLTLQGCEIRRLAAENFPFRRKGLLRTHLKTSKRGVY
jgi:hypothetical protein